MTWRDRLRPEINFTSPTGQQFTAAWVGDPRTIEKNLGVFEYPGVQGAVVQDLDVGGVRYSLSFYFEGESHDLDAERFFAACRERGVWSVNHPTKGIRSLQLVSVTEDVQPVSAGNMTLLTSEWIEPADVATTASVTQLSEAIKAQADTVQSVAADQFAAVVELDSPSKITVFKNAINAAITTINNTLAPLRQQAADIQAGVLSVHRGITDGLTAVSLDVLSLGGQMQALVTLPGQVVSTISAKVEYYSGLITSMIGFAPERPTAGGINQVAVQELVLTSAVVAISTALADSDPESREEAIQYIEDNAVAFSQITTGLDASQALYADNLIYNQYFSQSHTFNDSSTMITQTAALLLRKSFDLAVARRFTLTRNRAPVEIAADKYGDLDHLDFFISSNGLKGADILLLPAGREVVIYL